MGVDLHIHSTASDGTQTPEEIVRDAKRIGLTAIAIADHDDLCPSQEAARHAGAAGLPLIPAVEISTDYEEGEVHILGYWIDPSDECLQEDLRNIRDGRILRAQRIVDHLAELGIELTLEDVLTQAGRGSVGRPHIAQALVEAGVCRHPQEAFRRYLRKDQPAYVPRVRPSTTRAIEIVRQANGCPVLAHPGLIRQQPRIIEEMARLGVEGVEAYHPKHGSGQVEMYIERAKAQALLVTGGSDSHGPGGSYPVSIGAGGAPDSCAEALFEWRNQRNG